MYKNKREELIMSILEEKKYITVNELSKITYTSASSIRRDLSSLEKRGLIKRNYGVINTVCGIFLIFIGVMMSFGMMNRFIGLFM